MEFVDGTSILLLQGFNGQGWVPFTQFPALVYPDYASCLEKAPEVLETAKEIVGNMFLKVECFLPVDLFTHSPRGT